MKIALISDIHIHAWREFSTPGSDGVPSRLRDCVSVLTDMLDYCIEQSIGTVIVGGDIFHKRGVLYTQAYNLTLEIMRRFRQAEITVFVVDGNHDHSDKAGQIHAVESLFLAGVAHTITPRFGYENWHVSDDNDDSLVITGLSYCDSVATFAERVDAADQEYRKNYRGEARIIVAHHGFKDARVGSALEYVVKEEIDASTAFAGVERDYLFSGHYHQKQPIAGSKHAMYIGSPLEHTRGDGGSDKGFLVYDTKKKTVHLVPLKRPRFVQLTQSMIDDRELDIVEGNFVDFLYDSLTIAT